MAKDTIIVEFVGLPACGKSTLCEQIKLTEIQNGKKVLLMNDLTRIFKHSSPLKILGSIQIHQLLNYSKLFITLPIKKGDKYYKYWFAIKISILYKFARKYLDADIVLVDHGYFQHAVSMQEGDDISQNTRFLKQFTNIMNSETQIDFLIKCIIDRNIAMQRMKIRNRKKEGRLDAFADNNTILEEMFLKEEKNFNTILQYAENVRAIRKTVLIDMSSDLSSISDTIMYILGGGSYEVD